MPRQSPRPVSYTHLTLPSPSFLARYGVYVVPAAFKAQHAQAYARLQQALIQARATPEFQSYIASSALQDLSVGRPGEDFAAAFASDLAAIQSLRN